MPRLQTNSADRKGDTARISLLRIAVADARSIIADGLRTIKSSQELIAATDRHEQTVWGRKRQT